jgi:hypothetical protein
MKHQQKIHLLLTISLALLTVNCFAKPACVGVAIADVCHREQYYEQVVEKLERSKCFLRDS